MFAAVMMSSSFGGGRTSETLALPPALPNFFSSPYRPARPSPLSSSPTRASSPPALSQRDTQSSPILSQCSSSFAPFMATTTSPWEPASPAGSGDQCATTTSTSTTANKTPFRFATRPAKPVPRIPQNRDATRQTRRSLFLRNVRQRADDRAWDRRNCAQELEKLEWWSLERERRQAKEADIQSMVTEHDIEDAADWMWLSSSSSLSATAAAAAASSSSLSAGRAYYHNADDDEDEDNAGEDDEEQRMADRLAMEEEAELEALIASMEAEGQPEPAAFGTDVLRQSHNDESAPARPNSTLFSDDGDYDELFAELLSEQQQQQQGDPAPSSPSAAPAMQMGEDTEMS
ncbi:hypothetical protein SPI_01190 [Niveomyces insectorum RCEF 264]|uniref:Uncharacterized protein n=1 Tax=Niveomyces insectorum RCEF 264 TaxID=1081102 RepID=A0A162L4I6_9HYPO|nr:hypothetical protein SPI_01190 [Niveomyces insectorum RCEF 264]